MDAEAARPPIQDLVEVTADSKIRIHPHAGQWRAWQSEKRFILVLAGLQSGKTSFGPPWLWREMQRCGPGDYLMVSPSFTLLELKALPEFRKLFCEMLGAGTYVGSPIRVFTLSPHGERLLWGSPQLVRTHVYFGHADNPDSLESMTVKAAWLDEAGQKRFKLASWRAILGRLALSMGRVLFTTTPYVLGWLKKEIYDPWVESHQDHPEIEVVNFPSSANPRFPKAEIARAKRTMPRWLYRMRYRGLFERPAGLIYGCFDEKENICDPFVIPEAWPRIAGVDFGGVNTAAIKLARELDPRTQTPTGRYFAYAEYHAGGRTAAQHKDALTLGEPRLPTTFGGSKSEGHWRLEFSAAGLSVQGPAVSDVEIGILRVYELLAIRNLIIFRSLEGLIDQVKTYARVLDENGQPTEEIEDKETYHYLDGLRYAVIGIGQEIPMLGAVPAPHSSTWRYSG